MDQCTHEVRMQYWKNIILQCQKRQEGMTARAWLKENGISEASYYSWLKRIRQEAFDQMKQSESLPMIQENEISFTEVKIPKHNETKTTQQLPTDAFTPAAILKTSYCSIALTNDISDNLLARIMQEVRNV